jgi:hypothetical protein
MALFDNEGLFSEDQAITADAASTNIIDTGEMGTPIGNKGALVEDLGLSDIEILVQVTEDFNNLTSMAVQVQMDTTSAFGSATTIATSETAALADLKAGYRFRIPCEIPEGATERYIRLNYDITGTAPTTGKVFAGIVAARPMAVNRL